MKRLTAVLCMLSVMIAAAGCGREKEIIGTEETTTASISTTASAEEETEGTTTAAHSETQTESAQTTASSSADSTTASADTSQTETSALQPVGTKPVVTGTAATKNSTTRPSTSRTATTSKTTQTTRVTGTQTAPIVTQEPTGTHTGIPIPEQPQTDVQTNTEPVLGTVKIVNGVMVVDSGTSQARALEIFSGSFKTGTRYAQALNRYKAALGENVNVYCMVVPTSAAYYMPDSHASKYGSQLNNYNNIAASLDGVIGVPVYSAIEAHTSEYLYSRTDYHWQPLAAYYAGEQFAMTAGVPYATLDTYTPVVREGYVGAFYAVNKVRELANAPDTFTYYKPANLDRISCTYYNTSFGNARKGKLFFENNSIGASYTVFVGTDNCILQVDTDVDNGRVLVIFKDSYGNALVPFLTQSFSKIYLCDFRYFDRNAIAFAQQVGATDMLFAMSTVACTTSSKVGLVEKNLVK
ncbi:MAG: hypothetical protein IKK51_03640 [Oscillospiraceae bacterium]|nr:hypothetical protein [Oscillospiraceae bacterium]